VSGIVEVEDLARRFGAIEAVRGVTFAVADGEIFGFLGPNGAGKTTTMTSSSRPSSWPASSSPWTGCPPGWR
jgi:ABC-2 type transport system ATP-binding protein